MLLFLAWFMKLYDLKTRRQIEVLYDLAEIHNDRITDYQFAIKQLPNVTAELQRAFERMISAATVCKEQLMQTMSDLTRNNRLSTHQPFHGKVYRAWTELKMAFSGIVKKVTLASCTYNEEIALHAYKAALTTAAEMPAELRQLIELQESELKKAYETIKNINDTHNISRYQPQYLYKAAYIN